MADVNYAEVVWQQFPNNKITTDGFYSEWFAKDYGDLAKAKTETATVDWYNATTLPENVYYEKNSQNIILKPDIMPIDMLAEEVTGTTGRLQGDWWGVYDSKDSKGNLTWSGYAAFAKKNVHGDPKRQILYQNRVQYKENIGTAYKGVWWGFLAGDGYGYALNEQLNENQGIVLWCAENELPENEKGELTIYLFHRNPSNLSQVLNGIKILLKDDSDIVISHLIDIGEDTGKKPSHKNVLTQWQKGTVSAGKDVVKWSGKTKVYTMMIVDKYILFGINGMDNPFVMECQNYETGTTPDGLKYPIILRENSTLHIAGKGQASVGFKKLAYHNTANIKLPEVLTGYVLTDPSQIIRVKKSANDNVTLKAYQAGTTADTCKVYGDIKLDGNIMTSAISETGETIDRLKAYRKIHTETTPVFNKVKIWDDQVRSSETIELPDDLTGVVTNYTQTASAGENNVITDYKADITCYGDFDNMYSELLGYKKLHGKVYRKLTTDGSNVSDGGFIFTEPEVKINNYGKISINISGQELALSSLANSAGYIISYDDKKNKTDVSAMANICAMANLTFSTDVTGALLPDTVEGQEGQFTFQPNTTFLEILQKLATVQGNNLYTDNSVIYYKKPKASNDFVIGRGATYLTENISIKHNSLYKSRVYVIGKAGETTADYKRGDKLVGIWRSSAIETDVGYTPFVKIDEGLTDWTKVKNEGDKLWARFNEKPFRISFDIVDATTYYSKIKLFNTFQWKDSVYTDIHDAQFQIVGYSKEINLIDCTANIIAEMT
jgi:hypothetical protein